MSFIKQLIVKTFYLRTWNCPVCDKAALYENLVIDGYFQDVIASQKLGIDDNEIQLHPDGSWSTPASKPDSNSLETKKSVQKVEVISDVLGKMKTLNARVVNISLSSFLEMITEDFPKSAIKTNFLGSTGTGTNKPSADTVDLTIDSDEDDDLLKSQSKIQPQKVKNNGM